MRKVLAITAVVGALAAAPVAFAAQATSTAKPAQKSGAPAQPAPKQKPASTTGASKMSAATHSTTGVVKSMDATTLVITKAGKKGEDMTFVVSPSTQKEGAVDVGTRVSVRYTDDGTTHTATAITARAASGKPAAKK